MRKKNKDDARLGIRALERHGCRSEWDTPHTLAGHSRFPNLDSFQRLSTKRVQKALVSKLLSVKSAAWQEG